MNENVFFQNTFGCSKSEFVKKIQGTLDETERERLWVLLKDLNKRQFYQLNPIQWMEDILHIKKESLIWSLNPGYEECGRTINGIPNPLAWDGTVDPIKAICDSLVQWKDIAVESATGTGKTYIAAAIVLWFLSVFPNSKVYTVATKKDGLTQNLWPEIQGMWDSFQKEHPQAELMSLKIRMIADGTKKDLWVAEGLIASVSAEEGSAKKARGKHAQHMLFVIDEANGVDTAIHEAIENTCTAPHNLRVLLGNPDHQADSLHQTAIRPDITHIIISAYDHPNIVGNSPDTPLMDHLEIIPGAVSWKSIFNRRNKYGPDPHYYNVHPLYMSMVRGICPMTSVHSLFGLKTLDVVGKYLDFVTQNGTAPRHLEEILHTPTEQDGFVEGFTRIYEKARQTHLHRYVIFGDVGGDMGRGDWHCAIVLDRIKMKVVAMIHMRGHRNYYIAALLEIANRYRTYDWENEKWYHPMLAWERNSVGALHLSQNFMAYPNLYRPRTYDKPKDGKARNEWGWFTNSESRKHMMDALEVYALELRTKPWRIPDFMIHDEMRTFEWNESKRRYEARGGSHDDAIMALAGALMIHKILPPPVPVPPHPDGLSRDDLRSSKRIRKEIRMNGRRVRNTKKASAYDRGKLPLSL